jgi:hypothetical protein
MFRVAQRPQRPHVQQSLFQQDSVLVYQPRLGAPHVRYMSGPGHSLRVPRQQIPPANSPKPNDEKNLSIAMQILKMEVRESRIQAFLQEMDSVCDFLSAERKAEIQSWKAQFAEIVSDDIPNRGFALGILIVQMIEPALLDPSLSDIEKERLFELNVSCGKILSLILQVELTVFLDVCEKGLIKEKQVLEENEKIMRKAQMQVEALNAEVERRGDHMNAVLEQVKIPLIQAQRNLVEMDQQAALKIEQMNLRINDEKEKLLSLTKTMEVLGEQEEKNQNLMRQCRDLSQRFGNGR